MALSSFFEGSSACRMRVCKALGQTAVPSSQGWAYSSQENILHVWKVSSLPPCSLQPFDTSCFPKPGIRSLKLWRKEQRSLSDIPARYMPCYSSPLPVVFPCGVCKSCCTQVKNVTSFWNGNRQELNLPDGVGISLGIWGGFEAGMKWLHAIGRDTLHHSILQQALSEGWPTVSWDAPGTALPPMKFSCQKIEHIWNSSCTA